MIKKDIKSHKVLCVGEILWDMLPSGAKAGGAPMNVALHLKRLGLCSQFAGRVGDDRLGKSLIEFLAFQGMDTTLVQIDTRFPTSTVEVQIGVDHNVQFEIIDNVAWDRFEYTENLKLAAADSNVLVYGTLASRHAPTRDTILSLIGTTGLKLIDVNLRPPFISKVVVEQLLISANIAKLNEDELRVIGSWYNKEFNTIDLTKWFAEKYKCQIVCITRGANGALIFSDGKIIEHPGYKVTVVDTVGSGDAFLAGFLAMYLAEEPIKKILEFACATGALVATKMGGTPDYHISEISKIMANSQ